MPFREPSERQHRPDRVSVVSVAGLAGDAARHLLDVLGDDALGRARSQEPVQRRRTPKAGSDRLRRRGEPSPVRAGEALFRPGRRSEAVAPRDVAERELAGRAVELFEKQPASEKRRLLDFVLSNCTWANGELTPEFRQPFDMIALEATACAKEKVAELVF
jgi:hypothetical protein